MWNACGSSCREPECSLPVAKGLACDRVIFDENNIDHIIWTILYHEYIM